MGKLSHHSLVVWQRADSLFIKVHLMTNRNFPGFERFELGSQLRRAAYSVAANIVEGSARRHRRDRLHFFNIAEGSLSEVAYCVHVAQRLRYITDEMAEGLQREIGSVGAPLIGLIRSTRKMPDAVPPA
jgi:four helix bundle protein